MVSKEFPARVEFTPISIGGEEFVQVRFADLSMQKRLEAEHRETREYLQHLVESSHMAIVTYGLDGMPKSWNSEAERLFGWSREEVLGGVWPGGAAMMVAGDGAEEELARLREAMESCQAARMKEPVISHRRRRDGSVLITSSVFSPIRDGTGVVIALGEFLRDITEQARTEEKARFLRELNRVIVENIRLGLAVLDTEGKVLYVNPALARMIGRSAAEMVDRRYMDVVEHAATQEAVRRLLEVVRATGAPAPPGEIDAAPEGVGRRRFRFQGVPLFHGQRTQRLRGVMLIVEDVTEARTLEMQLIQSEKLAAMGQLAAGVAHEIRSPLTTIYNAIYDLRDLVDLGHREVSEDIEIAMEEVRRVQEIINTLLDFARSGGGGALERLDLDEMIARTLRLIAKEFSNQRVTIRQELGAGPIALYFPENAMKQILLNLLTNALHAMPAGGVVTLRTRIAGGARRELVLEVEDTGVGIPEQNLRNIFDPFFTTKEPGRGTGLGLSVVHTAVKDHGGRIEVESVVGTGTLFRIHLPLGRPEGD